MLITANSSLEKLFAPSRGARPKLVHITPLYALDDRNKPRTITYTSQVGDGTYHFYLGAVEDELDLYTALEALEALPERIEFSGAVYYVNRIEINDVDIASNTRRALSAMKDSKKLKLIFASPTVLRDPLVPLKHKTLVPSVMNIFSTPVYIRLYLAGKLRRNTYMKTLLRIHRALSIPPTFWQTLHKKDLQYEPGRRVPTLIGYVNLHYNPENDPQAKALKALNDTLPLIQALGTGVGRAAGLGHITIEPALIAGADGGSDGYRFHTTKHL